LLIVVNQILTLLNPGIPITLGQNKKTFVMFKNHPKGLYVLFLSNMGERFGYYTMFAILALYLQDHFGWDETHVSSVYGWFMMGSYISAILGGLLADMLLGYGRTVLAGIVIMTTGYLMIAQPIGASPYPVYAGLIVLSLGVGLFKGNLVVLVGNLYEKPSLNHLRDIAFNIYYMGINIGAMFAPFAATGIKDYILHSHGFTYNSAIPHIAHDLIAGNSITVQNLERIKIFAGQTVDLIEFSHKYLDVLSRSYNWGFAIAGLAMLFSLIIFIAFRKYYKEADYRHKEKIKTGEVKELSKKETNNRMMALGLVFLIVIFFWVSFQQNGSTLTFFAKNYTNLKVGRFTYLLFDVFNLLAIFALLIGLILIFNKKLDKKWKYAGAILLVVAIVFLSYRLNSIKSEMTIYPELFQTFNPIFVVWLTPLVIGIFQYYGKKGLEPSTPAKIGIGMILAAFSFGIMIFASIGLPSVHSIGSNAVAESLAVSPYWLISNYFTISIAELYLSPMGLSFVSKVAPPKLRGSMQAGWMAAIAIGNFLAGYVGRFYQHWELWQFFMMLVAMSFISAGIMFALLKIINRASKGE
jgi:POT family proton-dependent oligopeptide transporter